jgi:hypothetical protein
MIRLTTVFALSLALGGCAYDYTQRTDRVAYSAGNAVKANLERETVNPTSASRYSTKGLGRNGMVHQSDPVVLPD